MTSAVNFLFFFLGCCVAGLLSLKRKKTGIHFRDFLNNLRRFPDGFKLESQLKDAEKSGQVEDPGGLIMTKNQVEHTYSPDTWQRRAYDDLISIILSREYGMKTFPCVYATKGFKSNDHRYVFLQSDDPSEPRNVRLLGDALRAYLGQSHSIGPNTSLVVICPSSPKDRSVEDYNLSFWGLLRGLRIYDSKPWPEHIPADTTTSRWAFCFEGVPWFFAVLTPAHYKRQSRYAPNFSIVIQPKWVFDVLFNTPERRQAACGKVRSLLADFDEIPLSPDIAHHGDPGTTESRQYYLLDENKSSFCPYSDLDK